MVEDEIYDVIKKNLFFLKAKIFENPKQNEL